MKSLITILIISLILAVLSTFIYLTVFRIYLSKRINNGIRNNTERKKLIDPEKFFLIIFIVFLIISSFCISTDYDYISSNSSEKKLIKCSNESLTDLINEETDIPGYRRYEKKFNGGVLKYIYYINEDKDSVFPSLLLYVDCNSKYTLNYRINDEKNQDTISAEIYNWFALSETSNISSIYISISCQTENVSFAIDF